MLAILEQTQRNHARPTERVILHMLRIWGRYDALVRKAHRTKLPAKCGLN
jgi:hypothetical protein